MNNKMEITFINVNGDVVCLNAEDSGNKIDTMIWYVVAGTTIHMEFDSIMELKSYLRFNIDHVLEMKEETLITA